MKQLLLCAFFILGLAACDQKGSTEGTREKATAEQEGVNQAENQNQATKAEKMEQDLSSRHLFYSALEGEYQGSMNVDNEEFKIKFTFVRSVPPYTGNRIRQLSEIENDLNNLFFHVQVIQWHPSDQATAVGCRVTGIKPNMDDGTLAIASTDCPNLYSISLAEARDTKVSEKETNAKNTAQKVKSQALSSVSFLVGHVQPSSSASKYFFNVERVK
jgi:hypothetical protein